LIDGSTCEDAMNPEPKFKVLLVEENRTDGLIAGDALAPLFNGDFTLTHVERLADAFNRIEAEKFDVVLLDLMLPDSSGLDTFVRLRRREPRLPVLVLTGLEDQGEGIKAMQEGAQDYLIKDKLDPFTLARAVRYAIERHQIAAKLRESEERLHAVTDTANVALATVNREHRYRYTNRAWANFLHLSREDLVGQPMADQLGALYDEQIRHRLEMAFWGERVSHDLVVPSSRSGAEERSFTVFYEPRGNLLEPLVVVVLVDVTERRRAHEALLARHQQLQALHAISEEVFTSTDLNAVLEVILSEALSLGSFDLGVIRLREPEGNLFRTAALRGYRDPETTKNKSIDLQNPETGVFNFNAITKKELIIVEDVPVCPGLAEFKKEDVQSAILVPIMAARGVLGTIQLGNRTPRKFPVELLHTLEALGNHVGIAIQKARLHQETERSLESIRALHEVNTAITSTLDVHIILNILLEKLERFVPIVSASTVRLLKPGSGALSALACRGVNRDEWMLRQERGPIMGRARQVVNSRAPVAIRNIETAPSAESPGFFRKHGLVSYLGVPLIAHHEIVGVLGLYTRQEHEFSRAEIDFVNTLAGQGAVAIHNAQLFEQINGQARELERANKVKDDFLSVMSHELRSPLNITVGYVGMMRDGLLGAITPEQSDALQKVLNHAADQVQMIEEILATTDLEARSILVDRQRVDGAEFLRQLQSDFDIIHDKDEPKLVWEIPEEPVPIVTDSRKLRQIVQNLVGNALKFTDRGAITVSAKTTLRAAEPRPIRDEQTGEQVGRSQWLEIKVSDTGVGIPPDELEVIFEKFHQVDASATRSHGGLGLGLYIAKRFTELLGGNIAVESEPGHGSTFTVTLPVAT
jgi:PAS domain S-box-containing protein